MSQIRPIFLIAGNTITGVLRGVVLNVLLVLALLMTFAFTSTGVMEQNEIRRMLVDSGLASITLLGAVIAILTGFTMIPSELESRTIYPVASKPVRRWQFVLGKFFGAAGINGITVAALSIVFFIVYYIKTPMHEFDVRLLWAVFMIFMMLVVLSGLIIFFSTFMSWIGTIIASLAIWFLGSYSQFIYDMSVETTNNPFSSMMLRIVQACMPNFQAMDMRYAIVHDEVARITMGQILPPLGAGMLYLVIALLLAILIFTYREL